MPSGRGLTRRFAALSALGGLFCSAGLSGVGAASTPLVWSGAGKLLIFCVLSDRSGKRLERQAALCERVRGLAVKDAPYPVEVIAAGDPAMLAPEAATLLVHASLDEAANARLLAFSLRVYRRAADGDSPLFGTAPRAVAASDTAALDAALEEGLGETLPWLARADAPRPINQAP